MRKYIFFEVLVLCGLFSSGFSITNPAPVYCENMGHTFNETHCIFVDNNSCEGWEFYNGECGQEYVKELPCREVNGVLSPGYECCEGLTPVAPLGSSRIDSGECQFVSGRWSVCAPCGNGICNEDYENSCNCPEDCGKYRPSNYNLLQKIWNLFKVIFQVLKTS